MRDQALTAQQAADWLNSTPEEVTALLASGRLKSVAGAPGTEPNRISLNSVVVLAESLPAELGIFRIGEPPSSLGESGAPRSRPGGFGRPSSEGPRRPPVIVERRPSRFVPGRG
ncbi:MAG TPA: hypothetical protein VK943_15480 [Arenibaculum sp.]|nr:hypothetical protein [Arenibaculum sp.]